MAVMALTTSTVEVQCDFEEAMCYMQLYKAMIIVVANSSYIILVQFMLVAPHIILHFWLQLNGYSNNSYLCRHGGVSRAFSCVCLCVSVCLSEL